MYFYYMLNLNVKITQMADKDVILKVFNGNSYDNIFPQINLNELGNYYVWENIKKKIDTTQNVTTIYPIAPQQGVSVQWAQALDDMGMLSNPQTITITDDTITAILAASPIYIRSTNGEIHFLPLNSTFGSNKTIQKISGGYYYNKSSNIVAKQVIVEDEVISYLLTISNNSPIVSERFVVFKGKLANKAIIETGYYVGTGSYGSSNPNTLQFTKPIKFLYVASVSYEQHIMWVKGAKRLQGNSTTNYRSISGISNSVIQPDSNSISWSNYESDNLQFNSQGQEYEYIALF